jgi:hypothetical protein
LNPRFRTRSQPRGRKKSGREEKGFQRVFAGGLTFSRKRHHRKNKRGRITSRHPSEARLRFPRSFPLPANARPSIEFRLSRFAFEEIRGVSRGLFFDPALFFGAFQTGRLRDGKTNTEPSLRPADTGFNRSDAADETYDEPRGKRVPRALFHNPETTETLARETFREIIFKTLKRGKKNRIRSLEGIGGGRKPGKPRRRGAAPFSIKKNLDSFGVI